MTFNIKNLAPSGPYKHGDFSKYNPKKYFGELPILYRSGLELIFMRKMESNPEVEKWSSEDIKIPYIQREKIKGKFVDVRHTYNTDFTVIMKTGIKYVIEIKATAFVPLNETQIQRNPTMRKNAFKWRAAIAWCKANDYIFRVITEKDLEKKTF
ncbi:hypothetical protein M0Q97_08115 [Candidatus Dojkabacteria bacterium]|jgi:hypothetical protein|nr:hypothetical protein [Candidatus Dojkabacteria bacterium]